MPPHPLLPWHSLTAAYAWLPAAVWVFDLEGMRIAWANPAALALWRAQTLEELAARDFSDLPRTTVERMQELTAGEAATVNWTLWPRGVPVAARLTRTPIALGDGRRGLLAHASPLADQRALAEKRLLEMVSTGEPLARVLEVLVREIEALSPELLCSVLLLDDQLRLHCAAAPTLPPEYNAKIEGIQAGPTAGSCGTAAWRGELVIVSDIAADPLWADYRDAALPYGLRACWSIPIKSAAGEVLGTFAAYYREPREPSMAHLELLESARHIAGIAIERARGQAAMEKHRGELQTAMDSLPAMICYADTTMRFVYANQRYADWLGCRREALRGRHIRDIVGEDTFTMMLPYLQQALAGHAVRYERRQRGNDGVLRDFDVHYVPHRDAAGAVCGYFVMLTDVTERKKDEEMLHFLANHDQLTSLPNRNLFGEHLAVAVTQAERNGERLAALFIDLDRFKNVNDSLGHESGDLLLQQVARRFRACLRESDIVARLGGDEYTVLLRSVHDSQEVAVCAQKLRRASERPQILRILRACLRRPLVAGRCGGCRGSLDRRRRACLRERA